VLGLFETLFNGYREKGSQELIPDFGPMDNALSLP
jgi:hypothetical protein